MILMTLRMHIFACRIPILVNYLTIKIYSRCFFQWDDIYEDVFVNKPESV
jgi:hypothetical protein